MLRSAQPQLLPGLRAGDSPEEETARDRVRTPSAMSHYFSLLPSRLTTHELNIRRVGRRRSLFSVKAGHARPKRAIRLSHVRLSRELGERLHHPRAHD